MEYAALQLGQKGVEAKCVWNGLKINIPVIGYDFVKQIVTTSIK